MKSLAEVAYDAYRESRNWHDLPSLENSPAKMRTAWDAVARAVVAAHERNERARRDELADRAADAEARRFGVQS